MWRSASLKDTRNRGRFVAWRSTEDVSGAAVQQVQWVSLCGAARKAYCRRGVARKAYCRRGVAMRELLERNVEC